MFKFRAQSRSNERCLRAKSSNATVLIFNICFVFGEQRTSIKKLLSDDVPQNKILNIALSKPNVCPTAEIRSKPFLCSELADRKKLLLNNTKIYCYKPNTANISNILALHDNYKCRKNLHYIYSSGLP